MSKSLSMRVGGAALAALLVLSLAHAGGAATPAASARTRSARPLAQRMAVAAAAGRPTVLLATARGRAAVVADLVRRAGGQVLDLLADADFVVARVPAAALSRLEAEPAVAALAVDRPVRLDPQRPEGLDRHGRAPSAADPSLSLAETGREIGADTFRRQSDGRGVVVAVLDTGVDPGHPDLQTTSDGRRKLVDWQDFTGEGDVSLSDSDEVPAGVTSRSGRVKVGHFKEEQIPRGEMQGDINRNGQADDRFTVVLADPNAPGQYDTVHIDVNLSGQLDDDPPLRAFAPSGDVGCFGTCSEVEGKPGILGGVHFVVAGVDGAAGLVTLGYDGGSHGTHVAGIAAGHGRITGVAPGAQVMAIKVLTSGGSGSWAGIVRGMHYAASRGARVINMSLGGMDANNDGHDPQSLLVDRLSEQYNAAFAIAAGNSGPGLNTVAQPGVAGAAVTAGAYISPETFAIDYNLPGVPSEGLWYFSSNGPRDDGGLKPNVVAPGSAVSSLPGWAGSYQLLQGTSMASPQTAGALALLAARAQQDGIRYQAADLKRALELGARRLQGYGWAEQGWGLVQVGPAYTELNRLVRDRDPGLIARPESGLFARSGRPEARQPWTLINPNSSWTELKLDYRSGSSLRLSGPTAVTLSPYQRRTAGLRWEVPVLQGYYDALVTATAAGNAGHSLEYLATAVVPHEFDPAAGNRIAGVSGAVEAAKFRRYFFRVPEGTGELDLGLAVPVGDDGRAQGRVRLLAFAPDGLSAGETPYAGAPSGPNAARLTIPRPAAGVWEVDVYASHGAPTFGFPVSRFTLDAAARGVYSRPAKLTLQSGLGGGSAQATLSLTNLLGDFTGAAAGMGLAAPEAQRLTLPDQEVKDIFFELPAGTALYRARTGAADDPAGELSLGLYYNDPKNGWRAVGSVTGRGSAWQATLVAPEPGQYAVEVVAAAAPRGQLGFDLETVTVAGGDMVAVVDQPAHRPFGGTWEVPVTVRFGRGRQTLHGAVVVRDQASGRFVGVVPIEVRPGW